MGTYGQELLVDTVGQMLGAITHLCGALCATPPTSIVGAILWTGYFSEAVLSHVRVGGPLIAVIAFAMSLALTVWVVRGLRDKSLRTLMPA
jgi:uncharacterized membrane protein